MKGAWAHTLFILTFLFQVSLCALPLEKPQSIYSLSPTLDGAVILAGAAITSFAYGFNSNLTHKRCPCDRGEINSFDRGTVGNNNKTASVTSDVLVAASVLVPLIYDCADVGWSKEFFEDSLVLAEVLAVNSALNTVVKFSVQRPTPLAYSGESSQANDGYHSFYSGHTSTAFSTLAAASMVLHLRHHSGAWPWIATGAIGTAVALLRIEGGHHFYSDVIVGGLVGTGLGILIPWLHEKQTETDKFIFAPIGGNGVALLYLRKL